MGERKVLISEKKLNELLKKGVPFTDASGGGDGAMTKDAFGKFLSIVVTHRKNRRKAFDYLKENRAKFGKSYESIEKALTATDFSQGGAVVPTAVADEIVPYLYNQSVVRKLNPNIINLTTGFMNIPTDTSGVTTSWNAEMESSRDGSGTTGAVNLTAKRVDAYVAASNLLLKSSPNYGEYVVNQVTAAIASAQDAKFIRGEGTSSEPKGLLNWIGSDNKFNSNGKTLANIYADTNSALTKVALANNDMLRAGWIMSPRSYYALRALTTDGGVNIFGTEMDKGTFMGHAFGVTNNVPINLTSVYSEVYLADFSHAWLGEMGNFELIVDDRAAFVDKSGNVTSALAADATVILGRQHVDFALDSPTAGAVIEQVQWGVA